MRNPNALTDAVGQFRRYIHDKPPESIVVTQLGEVDCGYVIWYRAKKYSEAIEEQLKQSIDAYFEFVDELLAGHFKKIVITSATLPTITDDDEAGEVVQRRSAVKSPQRDRTELTLQYNALLRKGAVARRLYFADMRDDFLNRETGLSDVRFRNKNPADHHMDAGLASIVWARHINTAADFYDPLPQNVRDLAAVEASFAKALPSHSQYLKDDQKLTIKKGDQLVADVGAAVGEFIVIRAGMLNGHLIGSDIRLLHSRHWKDNG